MRGSGGITAKQEKAIAVLLACPTHEEAARAAGISVATLQRHLNDETFVKAYRAARRKLVEAAVGRLQGAAGKAVETLERNLTAGKPGDQIRAAVAILEHAYKGAELLDLAERLELVEKTLKGSG
jgi:hypothetical protein